MYYPDNYIAQLVGTFSSAFCSFRAIWSCLYFRRYWLILQDPVGIVTVSLFYSPSPEKIAQNKLSLPQPDRKENVTTKKENTATNTSGAQEQLELLTPTLPKLSVSN